MYDFMIRCDPEVLCLTTQLPINKYWLNVLYNNSSVSVTVRLHIYSSLPRLHLQSSAVFSHQRPYLSSSFCMSRSPSLSLSLQGRMYSIDRVYFTHDPPVLSLCYLIRVSQRASAALRRYASAVLSNKLYSVTSHFAFSLPLPWTPVSAVDGSRFQCALHHMLMFLPCQLWTSPRSLLCLFYNQIQGQGTKPAWRVQTTGNIVTLYS